MIEFGQKVTLLSLYIFITTFTPVYSINCYQCSGTDSENPFECTEFFSSNNGLTATNCSSIHDAQFCIKLVGRYEAIDCLQCNSSTTMECGDGLMKLDGGVIKPKSCEHVYNAQYCIKQIGGISTKRYCSSLDLGNYCNYVQQPGDKLEYRTCIYTCSTDGCNSAAGVSVSAVLLLFVVFVQKFII